MKSRKKALKGWEVLGKFTLNLEKFYRKSTLLIYFRRWLLIPLVLKPAKFSDSCFEKNTIFSTEEFCWWKVVIFWQSVKPVTDDSRDICEMREICEKKKCARDNFKINYTRFAIELIFKQQTMTQPNVCGCRMVGHNGHCPGKVRTGTSAEDQCTTITGAMRITPIKVLEMLLDPPPLGMAVEFAALMAAYRLPRPDPRNLRIGHNRIWAKADKVDSKFSMVKDHVILRCTFSKHRIVIPTREEWGKTGPINWGKGMSGLQMEPVISKRLWQEFENTKAKYSGTLHWDRMV